MTHATSFVSVRLFDAAIYFWMPQINILILRLLQRRNLRHRMVGRTVVIGDIPWVAQSAEAFLSKVNLPTSRVVVSAVFLTSPRLANLCFSMATDICVLLQHCWIERVEW